VSVRQPVNLVWFKRDLRIHDHAPLSAAAKCGLVLPLYVLEPQLWQQPDASVRQYEFLIESLTALDAALRCLGQGLIVRVGEMLRVLAQLQSECTIQAIYTHEETGNAWTYARDLAVLAWAKNQRIPVHSFRQFGVVRGLIERKAWARQWHELMHAPKVTAPDRLAPLAIISAPLPSKTPLNLVPNTRLAGLDLPVGKSKQQLGGRVQAHETLHSFFDARGEKYTREMSAPLSATRACSRLSPYLALGCLSMREVYQAASKRQAKYADAGRSIYARSLGSFLSRLRWHCHFIQKLETEPALEFHNTHRGFDGLRESEIDLQRVARWARGETGWPLVDACMRSLNGTGWLNFRMRAMLIATSSYQLWQHWREPGLHLARMFLDFEPGIHWSQVQMQSAVTGINIPRMYNPVKQSQEQDPNGLFIRQWLPELAGVPNALIHTPWLLHAEQQRQFGVRLDLDYPMPMLNHETAARAAKAKLSAYWQRPEMAPLSAQVLRKHGSHKRTLTIGTKSAKPRKTTKTARIESKQRDLFD
jgi:deoxyribodipyrimidine photo-lyase